MYPTIASRLRAGLVVLIVALFIQLVSAVPLPVPAPQSATLSSRSNHAGLELIGRDTGRINGPISTASAIAGTLAARDTPFDEDNELVRRKIHIHIANKVKNAFKKIGRGFKKIGQGIAKVAKFGLKIVATVQKAASVVAKFIPGVGKFISKGIAAESKVTNAISNVIPAKLSPKLQKGMRIMNKAQKYIPRRRDLSEE